MLYSYELKTKNSRTAMLIKGIPLAAGTAIALVEKSRNMPCYFNRKTAKGHSEGGCTVDGRSEKMGFFRDALP
ncbi:Orotate phosphoribosyltransferase [Candidatus Nitrotoga arctica]|uniref:Orotate phosphoribosyltransferase n=1 Tax=Candidatus Nitrotoga arctica TaxID=453162 RepID=A0ABM8Z170_9PROT|nr:Orotate phosphoribosyltransferase [Candidatus Nitrotoga arctica]